MSDLNLVAFYGWWEFATCLFAFLALIGIWFHLGRKKGDVGQVWLALSVLCWSLSGIFEIAYSQGEEIPINGWRSVFSLLNSLFILFSLPWFRYLPGFLSDVINSRYWYLIVGVPFLFCLIPTVGGILRQNPAFTVELDVYYAIMTLGLLGLVLWESFSKRGLRWLANLSVVFVIITLVSQLYKFTDDHSVLLLTSAIFKSILIMIFFALALSWVTDLIGMFSVPPQKIFLKLEQVKSGSKWNNVVTILGVKQEEPRIISLSAGNYKLLRLFSTKRKDEDDNGGYLEIKPKHETRTSRIYPIRDYNELKRLTISILDGIYGKDNWSKDRHEIPFKEAFWEFSPDQSRQIRLRIPPQNIEV